MDTIIAFWQFKIQIYDIEAALHKNVDLAEDKALNPHIRPQVMSELKTIYGQG